MFAGGELLLPYLQGYMGFSSSQENNYLLQLQEEELLQRFSQNHLLDDSSSCRSHLPIITSSSSNLMQTSTISEYDLGGEGDLFKAPEPIIEEPVLTLDPVTTAISMISAGEDFTATEAIKVAAESIESEQLISEVLFYECKNDLILLENPSVEEPPSDLSDIKIQPLSSMEDNLSLQPLPTVEDHYTQKDNIVTEGPLQKSVSSACLTINDRSTTDCLLRPNFLDFQEMDFGAVFGMKRSYSEGNIEVLGKDDKIMAATNSVLIPPVERLPIVDNHKSEERKEKLSRYRNKKTKRNFGRKIKYACRKALADCQPRIRGRFAKTEDCEFLKAAM